MMASKNLWILYNLTKAFLVHACSDLHYTILFLIIILLILVFVLSFFTQICFVFFLLSLEWTPTSNSGKHFATKTVICTKTHNSQILHMPITNIEPEHPLTYTWTLNGLNISYMIILVWLIDTSSALVIKNGSNSPGIHRYGA